MDRVEREVPSMARLGVEKALETETILLGVIYNGKLIEIKIPYGKFDERLRNARKEESGRFSKISNTEAMDLVKRYLLLVEGTAKFLRPALAALENPFNREEGVCEISKLAEFPRAVSKGEVRVAVPRPEEYHLLDALCGESRAQVFGELDKGEANLIYPFIFPAETSPLFIVRNRMVAGPRKDVLVFSVMVADCDSLNEWLVRSHEAGTNYQLVGFGNNSNRICDLDVI